MSVRTDVRPLRERCLEPDRRVSSPSCRPAVLAAIAANRENLTPAR
ncbi:hypothetical protein OV203_18460 [Nannocystis sp. ILAH1]|nr:hypothetical protein [Nannocystis sp. ILAH1]MCY0989126.1 hypothetical protein [Nannocystis sp. ILAH1]